MNGEIDIARTSLPAETGAAFESIVAGSIHWRVRTTARSPELARILENPDACLPAIAPGYPRGQASTTVSESAGMFLKRYNHYRDRSSKLLKGIFRPAPSRRAFEIGCRLIEAGLRSPAPIAFGCERTLGILRRGYLITELIDRPTSLMDWTGPWRTAARDVAQLLAKMHDAGFLHRDLNLTNLLYDCSGRLFLVDLDTARLMRTISAAQTCSELANFARNAQRCKKLPGRMMVEFLSEYCRLRRLGDWRPWWKQIEVLQGREEKRHERRKDRTLIIPNRK